jgi:NADP-dependent 3-hydroxy acid dehydrogenase YdfG
MSTTADRGAGRVAVITGASSGIGEATARALAASGHRLALLARRGDRIQALADELGNGAIAIEADVTDRDSIIKATPRVEAELGGADILITNAHPGAKQAAEQMYEKLAITADDIAEVIAFAVTRPRRMTINEILVRPTAQP